MTGEDPSQAVVEPEDRRRRFERLIMHLATQFINQPPAELPDALEAALGEVCRYVESERGFVLRFTTELDAFSCIVEWAPSEAQRLGPLAQEVPTGGMGWWLQRLRSGAIQVLESADELPEDQVAARALMEATGVEALVEVPVFSAGRLAAVVGLASDRPGCAWGSEDLDVVTIAAHVIANAMERMQREEALLEREHQLLQAQKMESVGRLAGGIAHDFNNLLFAITSTSELVLMDLPDEAPLTEDIREILQAAERASSLTQQLLAYARRQELDAEVIRLNDSLREILALLPRVLSEDIQVVRRLDSALPTVEADRHLIEQLVMNLAANARDAMPQGGIFTLETRTHLQRGSEPTPVPDLEPGRYAVLCLSDDGEGMAEEVRANIFEPFYTTRPTGQGTGLGLAAVQGIVEQHSGHIRVESTPGEGTRFEIYFPAAGGRVPSSGTLVAAAATGEGETVLLVEDAPLPRQAVRRILERAEYRVLEASNGLEALSLCRSHDGPIHLLLTDIVMPIMSGQELRRQVAEVRPEAATIFMSGYSPETIPNAPAGEEGVRFLQKPITMPVLLDAVRRTLRET